MKYSAIAACAALITVGCATAESDLDREAREGSVFVSAIQTEVDAALVLDKLSEEAERICSDADKWPNWRLHQRVRRDEQRCISEVIESGVVDIDDPRLTALWKAQ